jgi:hypothetical protein
MSVKIHNFRIGLFVLVGAGLFIGALFAMGLKSYFGEKVVFETYVPGKVENLAVGALVKLRGVTIGKVSAIDFVGSEYPEYNDQSVVIRFEVPKDFQWWTETNDIQGLLDKEVAKGLRARIQGQGFLGANIVALEYVDPTLYPVEAVPWKPKHYYIPSAPNQFNRVLASLETSLRHVENLDVADLLNRVQLLIDAANKLVANVNRINFDELGTNANALIVEFRDTNRGLQQTLTDARRTLADAQYAIKGADIPQISRNTIALEDKLSATVTELHRLLARVDVGDLNDSLANIRSATDELTVLLHKIRERPSSVVFSKSPAPVTELEQPAKK